MPLEQPLNIVYQRQDPMHQEAAGWNLETNQAAMGGLKFSAKQKKEQSRRKCGAEKSVKQKN